MKAHEILNTAAGHLEERGKVYDKPEGERSMPNVVAAFSAITGVKMTAEQGWLFMTLVKAVRSQQGDYKGDNYEDGAAYFALMGEQASQDRSAPFPDTHLDFDEARADAIGQNGNDGEHYAEDMTDPDNWRAGDLVECLDPEDSSSVVKGGIYKIRSFERTREYSYISFFGVKGGLFLPSLYRFHSRPSADGWIDWHGGECPCDGLSRVEVEMRDGGLDSGQSSALRWTHKSWPGDIIRYRML